MVLISGLKPLGGYSADDSTGHAGLTCISIIIISNKLILLTELQLVL